MKIGAHDVGPRGFRAGGKFIVSDSVNGGTEPGEAGEVERSLRRMLAVVPVALAVGHGVHLLRTV